MFKSATDIPQGFDLEKLDAEFASDPFTKHHAPVIYQLAHHRTYHAAMIAYAQTAYAMGLEQGKNA